MLGVLLTKHAAKVLPMHVLMRYAGHSNIQTTAKFYAKTTVSDDEAMGGMVG